MLCQETHGTSQLVGPCLEAFAVRRDRAEQEMTSEKGGGFPEIREGLDWSVTQRAIAFGEWSLSSFLIFNFNTT